MSLRTGTGSFAGELDLLILSNSNHAWFGILTLYFLSHFISMFLLWFTAAKRVSSCTLSVVLGFFSHSKHPCFMFTVLVLVLLFIFPVLDSFLMTRYPHSCTLDSDERCVWYSLHILNRYLCYEWTFLSKFRYMMISRDLDFKVPWISVNF